MRKGINLACMELKEKLVNEINTSEVPVINIRYILTELLNEAVSVEKRQIEREVKEYQASMEANKENVTNNDEETE